MPTVRLKGKDATMYTMDENKMKTTDQTQNQLFHAGTVIASEARKNYFQPEKKACVFTQVVSIDGER